MERGAHGEKRKGVVTNVFPWAPTTEDIDFPTNFFFLCPLTQRVCVCAMLHLCQWPSLPLPHSFFINFQPVPLFTGGPKFECAIVRHPYLTQFLPLSLPLSHRITPG